MLGKSLQNNFQSGDLVSSETSVKGISELFFVVAVSTIISFPVSLTHHPEMLSPVALASQVLLTYSNAQQSSGSSVSGPTPNIRNRSQTAILSPVLTHTPPLAV